MADLDLVGIVTGAAVAGVVALGSISWISGAEPLCGSGQSASRLFAGEKFPYLTRQEYLDVRRKQQGDSRLATVVGNVAYPGYLLGRYLHNAEVDRWERKGRYNRK